MARRTAGGFKVGIVAAEEDDVGAEAPVAPGAPDGTGPGLAGADVRRLRGVAVAAAVVAGVCWVALFRTMVYDDSFITYRYAQHLGDGHGLSWNIGSGWEWGSTSLGWTILGALPSVFGIRPETSMPILGAVCWVLLVVLLVPRIAARLTDSLLIAGAGVVAIAAIPAIGLHSLTGMETAGATLALAGALAAVGERRWTAFALLTVIVVLMRPDLALPVGAMWLVALVAAGRPLDRKLLASGAVAGLAIALVAAIMWAAAGTPVPNSFYVKGHSSDRGIEYVRDFAPMVLPLALPVLLALVLRPMATLKDRWLWLTALPAVLLVGSYLRTDPVLGEQWRFFVPVLPLLVLASVRGAAIAAGGRWPRLASVVLIVSLAVSLGVQGRSMRNDRPALQDYFGAINDASLPIGRSLRLADRSERLATGDAGAMPYFAELPTLDTIGLNDLAIAKSSVTQDDIEAFDPTILVLQGLVVKEGSGHHMIDGGSASVPLHLDEEAYEVRRLHSGLDGTFATATMPDFAEDFALVATLPFGSSDVYSVFVRRDRLEANEAFVDAVRALPNAQTSLAPVTDDGD